MHWVNSKPVKAYTFYQHSSGTSDIKMLFGDILFAGFWSMCVRAHPYRTVISEYMGFSMSSCNLSKGKYGYRHARNTRIIYSLSRGYE
jgi:hypothetical protein